MRSQQYRIPKDVSVAEQVKVLTGGNARSMRVLEEWVNCDPFATLGFLTSLDGKHLYDQHIWNVYHDVCGADIQRFIYHVSMELPDQLTGRHSISGPRYTAGIDIDAFVAKRRFGKPGSYWALKNPPARSDYAYPIV